MVQIADKFEHFLDIYRRPDGSRWGGQGLHDATGGVLTRSYVSNLHKGRIENPGFPTGPHEPDACRFFGIKPCY